MTFIFFPAESVLFDIFTNFALIRLIPDDMLIIISLPDGRARFPGHAGNLSSRSETGLCVTSSVFIQLYEDFYIFLGGVSIKIINVILGHGLLEITLP
jgi:hypothetical protein